MTNKTIAELETIVSDLEGQLQRATKHLNSARRDKCLSDLRERGINVGDKVIVKYAGYITGESGIFVGVDIKYGSVSPIIMKLTKAGAAHKTQRVYCYNVEQVHKWEDGEVAADGTKG